MATLKYYPDIAINSSSTFTKSRVAIPLFPFVCGQRKGSGVAILCRESSDFGNC